MNNYSWKKLDNKYLINENGEIYSLKSNKLLKPFKCGKGYLRIRINGKQYSIHRLVAETFIPNPNNLPQVNHKDENKLNNNVNNLEWCDNWYNTHYGTHYERVSKTSSKTFKNKYKNGFQPRKRAVIIVELNMIFPMIKDCAKYLNCSRTQVNDCAKGKYKTCRGYTIKYYE